MLVLALSLTISFHRPPLLILLGLLVYSQSFVRSQPSKLFFTTPSFPATIIHPINPMTDFSNKCSNKCNSPQFWYKLHLKQHPILTRYDSHKFFFSKVENLYKNFLDTRSNSHKTHHHHLLTTFADVLLYI